MVLIDAGEVGLQHASLPQIVLRPSLLAMSKIGDPLEIVSIATRIFSGDAHIDDIIRVLWSCTDDDVSAYTGYLELDDSQEPPKVHYVPGAMSHNDTYVIAVHLLHHGLIGKSAHKPKNAGSSANNKFDACDYVAIAIAHLGMSSSEAWQTTMTTLVNAMHSKFPDIGKPTGPGSNAPSIDELDSAMAELDRINKLRG